MDNLDLHDLLGEGAPEAGQDVLARIVRRHGRHRVRRARIAASAAVAVALAAAGTGIALSASPRHTLASASAAAPADDRGGAPTGLAWARGSVGPPAVSAAPGVFGWLAGSGQSSLSAGNAASSYGVSAPVPSAALAAPVAARYLPLCTTRGCGPIYLGESMTRLFERTVDGVTIEADLGRYDLPTGKMLPLVSPSGAVSSGQTGSGVTPKPARSSTGPAVRLALPCLYPSELIVTVSEGRSTATLAVPGAASTRPFSVVASASAELGGDDVVLAVTHTGASVRTVTSQFPGGGEDQMAPVDGWSVLVHRTHRPRSFSAAGAVTVEAAAASGRTLERVKLPVTGSLATAATVGTCHYWVPSSTPASSPPGSAAGSTGSASGSSTRSSAASGQSD